MTHPSQTIIAVISIVAIIGAVGALRLTPDANTDKLVDSGSAAYAGTKEFRDRFGDDAIVVLAQGDLQKLVLSDNLGQLSKLESCLAGQQTQLSADAPAVCQRIAALGATRVVFGPATFLSTAATELQKQIQTQIQTTQANAQAAKDAAIKAAPSRACRQPSSRLPASRRQTLWSAARSSSTNRWRAASAT